jgi:hypothetical protein
LSELPNREIACPDDSPVSREAKNYGATRVILDEVNECTETWN